MRRGCVNDVQLLRVAFTVESCRRSRCPYRTPQPYPSEVVTVLGPSGTPSCYGSLSYGSNTTCWSPHGGEHRRKSTTVVNTENTQREHLDSGLVLPESTTFLMFYSPLDWNVKQSYLIMARTSRVSSASRPATLVMSTCPGSWANESRATASYGRGVHKLML